MAGTVTVLRQQIRARNQSKYTEKIIVDWTADASDGSIPNTLIDKLCGYVFKVVTIPGSPAPTANYSIKLFDPEAPAFDTLINKLASRSASATEEVYPVPTGSVAPITVAGDYTLNITGNSVNSAKGRIIFYVQETF